MHYEFLGLPAAGLSVPDAKIAFGQSQNVDADAFAQQWPAWKQHWLAANLLRVRPKAGQQPGAERLC